MHSHTVRISEILHAWARATSTDRKDEILSSHSRDAVIFDVLPALRYDGAEEYKRSWGDWQPTFEIPSLFEIHDLKVFAGDTHAHAHGIIRCGGTLPDGDLVEDNVRATFCLIHDGSDWRITHQHISMPLQQE
jgi:ketosteroid isomerase-like protein